MENNIQKETQELSSENNKKENMTGTYIWNEENQKWIKISDIPRGNGIPDAYFKERYFDSNLADSKNPYGQWVESKQHKANIMRNLGVRESGDRRHGAR